MARIRVLGSLAAEVGGEAVDLGGPRQRSVLALLLVARGGVVSVDRLIDDLWNGEPPPRAIGALQAYVSNLRRGLEPERAPRTPARILVSAAPGYAVRHPAEDVDAWFFEALVKQAEAEPASRARHTLDRALDLWHGQAYAEVADEPWAQPEITRLHELRRRARERLTNALIETGDAGAAVAHAEQLTHEHPLHEEAWRLLALALHRSGRPADAQSAVQRARDTLESELGVEPGPALAELEVGLRSRAVPEQRVRPPEPDNGERPPSLIEKIFVGRAVELSAADEAVTNARLGSFQLMLVTGEAGAGKSAFMEQVRSRVTAVGWLTATGRCPETAVAPPNWPWVEIVRRLAGDRDPGRFRTDLGPLLQDDHRPADDVTGGRFRLHRAVAGWLAAQSEAIPLLLVIDDLHRADGETLAMLRSITDQLASERASVEVLLIAAYRSDEVSDQLEETLADLARHSPVRLRLGGLENDEARALIEQVAGRDTDETTMRALTDRTGGNPFYLRESARLLASEGELVATSEVPEGVRDVLRRRIARLPAHSVTVLRLAAVMGRDIDVDVLIDAAEHGEEAVIDALEAGVVAGLLVEPDSGGLRFAHVLVQETLLGDVPRLRRGRVHARLAAAFERLRPDAHAALAYHYAHAETPDTARRAVDASLTAAHLAASRYAHDAAARLYRQALDCLDRVERTTQITDDERAAIYAELVPALLWCGDAGRANQALDEALDLAERAGRDDLAVTVLQACDFPLPWLTRGYGQIDARRVAVLTRVIRHEGDARTRCRLLCVLVRELGTDDAPLARREGLEAVRLARELGEPAQLGRALGVFGATVVAEREPQLKRELAQEMLTLGRLGEQPSAEVLAHHLLAICALVAGDPAGFRQHLELFETLAQRYQLTQAADTSMMMRAMLAHVAGRLEEAETGYRRATAAIEQHGSLDADGMRVLAAFTLAATRGRLPTLVPVLEQLYSEFGATVGDLLALSLATAGRLDEAKQTFSRTGEPREDFFAVLLLTVRGAAAVAIGDAAQAATLTEALTPYADLVAGSSTAAFVFGPVAQVLGDLDRLQGHTERARVHYRQALEVSTRFSAPLWAATAQAALKSVE